MRRGERVGNGRVLPVVVYWTGDRPGRLLGPTEGTGRIVDENDEEMGWWRDVGYNGEGCRGLLAIIRYNADHHKNAGGSRLVSDDS